MTIIEAITNIDELLPNTFTQSEKVGWLSEIDGLTKRDIIDTHEGGESVTFTGYDDTTPIDTILLIGHPYEDVYQAWLSTKIHYHNQEFSEYNNAAVKYNDIYKAYENDYNRKHVPKGTKRVYF